MLLNLNLFITGLKFEKAEKAWQGKKIPRKDLFPFPPDRWQELLEPGRKKNSSRSFYDNIKPNFISGSFSYSDENAVQQNNKQNLNLDVDNGFLAKPDF